ncbi:MAG: preprotein translocase subunit YajC [Elusimicrobia bacterium RIFCSPLOWO2_01_FULL_60_11]|nr:MAG: preprotein translocase subunit YajC [Elusimicrobia bacterium RIFCSPLOWO2_01_FULL_60_11]
MTTYAYAETSAPAAPNASAPSYMSFVPILGMLAIFYFFMIRPQQKRTNEHKKMLEALRKDDKVVTAGGIYGTVVSVGDKTIELKIADNVKIKVTKNSVSDKLNPQETANGSPAVQLDVK